MQGVCMTTQKNPKGIGGFTHHPTKIHNFLGWGGTPSQEDLEGNFFDVAQAAWEDPEGA